MRVLTILAALTASTPIATTTWVDASTPIAATSRAVVTSRVQASTSIAASIPVAVPAPAPAPLDTAPADPSLSRDPSYSTDPPYTWDKDNHVFDCNPTYLDNYRDSMLWTKCPAQANDDSIERRWSEIDLNECLANDHGELTWRRNGDAFGSCKACAIIGRDTSDPVLSCWCDEPGDGFKQTAINLRYSLYTRDGVIHCFQHSGIFNEPDDAPRFGNEDDKI